VEIQRYGTNTGGQLSGFAAITDYPPFRRSDVVENGFEFPGVMGISPAVGLNFDSDAIAATVKDQVRFLTGGGAPKEKLSEGMREPFTTNEIFNDKTLPTRTSKRMVVQIVRGRDMEQMMQEPAVSDKNARSFDQPLADITKIRREAPDEKDPFQ
jgi:hypothetical protein